MNERKRHISAAGPNADEPDMFGFLAGLAGSVSDQAALDALRLACPQQWLKLVIITGTAAQNTLDYVAALRAFSTRLPRGGAEVGRWVPGTLQNRLALALGSGEAKALVELLVNAAIGWQPRLQLTFGRPLVATDFTLSAGWGTGAAVSWLKPMEPNLNRFQVKVTSGLSCGANPTIVVPLSVDANLALNWRDLPLPLAQVTSDDTAVTVGGVYAAWAFNGLDSSLTITYRGTPADNKGYVFNVLNVG